MLILRVSKSSPSAVEVLVLTIFAPQLHQPQLDLRGYLVQQGAEAEGRKFLGLEPTWRRPRGRAGRRLRL